LPEIFYGHSIFKVITAYADALKPGQVGSALEGFTNVAG
jgi:hypothetical protein